MGTLLDLMDDAEDFREGDASVQAVVRELLLT